MAFSVVAGTVCKTAGAVGNFNVTFPSGLAAGHLMVMQLVAYTSTAFGTPSGWTLERTDSSTNGGVSVVSGIYYKTATSGDVSAGLINVTNSASPVAMLGCVVRISGHNSATAIDANNAGIGTTASPNESGGATPTFSGDLVMIFDAIGSTATRSFSSQTIATSPPTFTEYYDDAAIDTTNAVSFSMAAGERSAATATGTASVTPSATTNNAYVCTVLLIAPEPFISVSDTTTPTDVATITQAGVISANDTVTPSDAVDVRYGFATNTKNSPSWNNTPKT